MNTKSHHPNSSEKVVAFSDEEIEFFQTNGYIIVRQLANGDMIQQIREVVQKHLEEVIEPVEYEADVHYPGAPTSRDALGGDTIRRLKNGLGRHPVFMQWVSSRRIVARLQQLLGSNVHCPLAHHNCVMTKLPQFSSQTGWHQDIRYWAYQQPELVSVWLALGNETEENGCLQVIPGTHRMQFSPHQFDDAKFFRTDLKENQNVIQNKIYAELNPGDVLFFHSLTLHAAGKNESNDRKFSAVFTFRSEENRPLPGTRSAQMPELLLPQG